VLDNPNCVSGRTILDFGSGSGLVGIAAAKSGARSVLACDVDAFAAAAIALNADVNDAAVAVTTDDLIGLRPEWQAILVGDMCYERPLAERILAWLHECLASGVEVLLGDPGRSYFPKMGVARLATYRVQTTRELEDREIRETGVYKLLPA
jgi:predicted nicotinamide N-methyase